MPDNWQCPTCKGVWSQHTMKCPSCGTAQGTDGGVESKISIPVNRAKNRMMLNEADNK